MWLLFVKKQRGISIISTPDWPGMSGQSKPEYNLGSAGLEARALTSLSQISRRHHHLTLPIRVLQLSKYEIMMEIILLKK